MKIKISDIEYVLPTKSISLDELAASKTDWDYQKIIEKTGIERVFYADDNQTALDLAVLAGERMLSRCMVREDIGLIILVTQSADYFLPTSACILQDKLKLSKNCIAFDLNLGCSGFVNALSVAGSMLEAGLAAKALVFCADTYSKYTSENDRTCKPVFSDAGSVVLLEESERDCLGPFIFGTDGGGYEKLIVRGGAAKSRTKSGGINAIAEIEMLGSDVFLFTMKVVPDTIKKLLHKASIDISQIDLFVFHQASKLVIDNIVRLMSLSEGKVFRNYQYIGNTVSSSIPIALKEANSQGRLKGGDLVMLVGFGVGLSWGATLVRWE
jgi:3-oxoacyl-[acyl-carrier-protein] synthase-3